VSINPIHRFALARLRVLVLPEVEAFPRPGVTEATFNERTLSDLRSFVDASTPAVVVATAATTAPGGLTLDTPSWLVGVSAAGLGGRLNLLRRLAPAGGSVATVDAPADVVAFLRVSFGFLGFLLFAGAEAFGAAFALFGFLTFTGFVVPGDKVSAGLLFFAVVDVVFGFLRFGCAGAAVDVLGVATEANAARSSGVNRSRSPSATNSYEVESSGMILTRSLGHSPSSMSSLCMTI